jgi:hypothetical protein
MADEPEEKGLRGAEGGHTAKPSSTTPPEAGPQRISRGFWDQYWDRFRRQQVDDPVEGNREGYWERFRRQQVDDPVDERRRRSGR